MFKLTLRRGIFLLISGRHQLLTKLTAVITLSCFLYSSVFSQCLYAFAARRQEVRKLDQSFEETVIPRAFGKVTEANYYGGDRVVINIQDLHCHTEVQRNIAKILGSLDEKYHLKKVYVEGGVGKIDTSWVNLIKNKKAREEVVEALVDTGKVTGTEYYSIRSGKNELLEGLEDSKIYEGNLKRLGEILEKRQDMERVLPKLSEGLIELKGRYFSSRNKRFEKLIAKNKEGKLNSEKYFLELLKLGERSGIDMYAYPELAQYLNIIALQKELDYKKISQELQEYLIRLKARLPYTTYAALIEKVNDRQNSDDLYLAMARISNEEHSDLSRYQPHLAKFFQFIEANQKVNSLKVVREERHLIRELHEKLSKTGGEREVAFLSDFFTCFEDYLNNKISAEDYAYFQRNKGEFKILWPKYVKADDSQLEPYYELLDEFYRVNVERNKIFLKNIGLTVSRNTEGKPAPAIDHFRKTIEALKDAKEVVVLVTGGFHTEGVSELLNEEGVTHLVITPNVSQETKSADEVYEKLAKYQARILSQTIALQVYSQKLLGLPVEKQFEDLSKNFVESKLTALFRKNSDLSPDRIVEEINKCSTVMGGKLAFDSTTIMNHDKWRFVYTCSNKDIFAETTIVCNRKTGAVDVSSDLDSYSAKEIKLVPAKSPLNLVMLGAPGAGKGTQLELLMQKMVLGGERICPVVVSASGLLKERQKSNDALGKLIKDTIASGGIVPDKITHQLVKERLDNNDIKERGFILDGFPRTVKAAEGLLEILEELKLDLDGVVFINIDEQLVTRRVLARRGQALMEGREPRPDDNSEAVRERFKIYREQTQPAFNYLAKNGGKTQILVINDSGSDSIGQFAAKINTELLIAGLVKPVVQTDSSAVNDDVKESVGDTKLTTPGTIRYESEKKNADYIDMNSIYRLNETVDGAGTIVVSDLENVVKKLNTILTGKEIFKYYDSTTGKLNEGRVIVEKESENDEVEDNQLRAQINADKQSVDNNHSGSWLHESMFTNQVLKDAAKWYRLNIAWWLETPVALAIGLSVPFFFPQELWITSLIVIPAISAAVFWGPHVFQGKKVYAGKEVTGLTFGTGITAMIAAAALLQNSLNPLVIGSITTTLILTFWLTSRHIQINAGRTYLTDRIRKLLRDIGANGIFFKIFAAAGMVIIFSAITHWLTGDWSPILIIRDLPLMGIIGRVEYYEGFEWIEVGSDIRPTDPEYSGETTLMYDNRDHIIQELEKRGISVRTREEKLPGDCHHERHCAFIEHGFYIGVPRKYVNKVAALIESLRLKKYHTHWAEFSKYPNSIIDETIQEMFGALSEEKDGLKVRFDTLHVASADSPDFWCICQSAANNNPGFNITELYELYKEYREELRKSVRDTSYTSDKKYRIITMSHDSEQLDDSDDDRRWLLHTGGEGIKRLDNDQQAVYLRQVLNQTDIYAEVECHRYDYGGRHFFLGEVTRRLYVPEYDAMFSNLCVLAGTVKMDKILFNKDTTFDEIARGIRELGNSSSSSSIGNKEKGFIVLRSLGLPYPPGIIVAEELVQKILSDRNARIKYGNAIEEEMRKRNIAFYTVRSNPKQSMPGVLETSLDIHAPLLKRIRQVGNAWYSKKSQNFRRMKNMTGEYDLPIIIQKWVSGTKPPEYSGTALFAAGVFSTRNPNTGKDELFGSYLENSSGDTIMTGGRQGHDINILQDTYPEIYNRLLQAKQKLESEYGPQEVEFAVEEGDLYFLQTRNLNFSPQGKTAYLKEQLRSGKISEARAIPQIEKLQKDLGKRHIFRLKQGATLKALTLIGECAASTPGVVQGYLTWDMDKVRRSIMEFKPVIFVSVNMNEVIGSSLFEHPCAGLITREGGGSSHEAVQTRLAGIPSLINPYNVIWGDRSLTMPDGTVLREGDPVILDGTDQILAAPQEGVVEEDKMVKDVSYGVDIIALREEVEKEYLNLDGTFNEGVNIEKLETLNRALEENFMRFEERGLKKEAFIANCKKHFHHLLLNRARHELQAPKQYKSSGSWLHESMFTNRVLKDAAKWYRLNIAWWLETPVAIAGGLLVSLMLPQGYQMLSFVVLPVVAASVFWLPHAPQGKGVYGSSPVLQITGGTIVAALGMAIMLTPFILIGGTVTLFSLVALTYRHKKINGATDVNVVRPLKESIMLLSNARSSDEEKVAAADQLLRTGIAFIRGNVSSDRFHAVIQSTHKLGTPLIPGRITAKELFSSLSPSGKKIGLYVPAAQKTEKDIDEDDLDATIRYLRRAQVLLDNINGSRLLKLAPSHIKEIRPEDAGKYKDNSIVAVNDQNGAMRVFVDPQNSARVNIRQVLDIDQTGISNPAFDRTTELIPLRAYTSSEEVKFQKYRGWDLLPEELKKTLSEMFAHNKVPLVLNEGEETRGLSVALESNRKHDVAPGRTGPFLFNDGLVVVKDSNDRELLLDVKGIGAYDGSFNLRDRKINRGVIDGKVLITEAKEGRGYLIIPHAEDDIEHLQALEQEPMALVSMQSVPVFKVDYVIKGHAFSLIARLSPGNRRFGQYWKGSEGIALGDERTLNAGTLGRSVAGMLLERRPVVHRSFNMENFFDPINVIAAYGNPGSVTPLDTQRRAFTFMQRWLMMAEERVIHKWGHEKEPADPEIARQFWNGFIKMFVNVVDFPPDILGRLNGLKKEEYSEANRQKILSLVWKYYLVQRIFEARQKHGYAPEKFSQPTYSFEKELLPPIKNESDWVMDEMALYDALLDTDYGHRHGEQIRDQKNRLIAVARDKYPSKIAGIVANMTYGKTLHETLKFAGPLGLLLGRRIWEEQLRKMVPGYRGSALKVLAPELTNGCYVVAASESNSVAVARGKALALLGMKVLVVMPLGKETTEGLTDITKEYSKASLGTAVAGVWGKKIETEAGRLGVAYYENDAAGTIDTRRFGGAVVKLIADNPGIAEKFGLAQGDKGFTVSAYECDSALGNPAVVDDELKGAELFEETVMVLNKGTRRDQKIRGNMEIGSRYTVNEESGRSPSSAAEKTFDVTIDPSDDVFDKLKEIESKRKKKREVKYREGDPLYSLTVDMGRFEGGMNRLESKETIGKIKESKADTIVVRGLSKRMIENEVKEFNRLVKIYHDRTNALRVVSDYQINAGENAGEAIGNMVERVSLGSDGVRVDLTKYEGEIALLSKDLIRLKQKVTRINRNAIVAVILPDGKEFSDRTVYEAGIKRVVRFLPGQKPAHLPDGTWLEMALEDGTSVYHYEASAEAFEKEYEELMTDDQAEIVGLDYEIVIMGMEKVGAFTFREFCAKLYSVRFGKLVNSPAYRYRQGYRAAFTLRDQDIPENVDAFYELLMVPGENFPAELVKAYGKLLRKNSAPGLYVKYLLDDIQRMPENKEQILNDARGYVECLLEHAMIKKFMSDVEPLMYDSDKEIFGWALVRARLAGMDLPVDLKERSFNEKREVYEKLIEQVANNGAVSNELKPILDEIHTMDMKILNNVSIGSVTPEARAIVNLLTVMAKGNSDPLVVVELLKMIDLYADKDVKTLDKMRREGLNVLPMAFKEILTAA